MLIKNYFNIITMQYLKYFLFLFIHYKLLIFQLAYLINLQKPTKFLHNSQLVNSVRSSRKSIYSNKSLEPVLNTRMKNLSNFSFRYKDNEHERIVVQRSHTCRVRDLFCTWPLYIGFVIALSILLLVILLFSNPKSFTSYYENIYLPDGQKDVKPKISLCLSMPFDETKLRANGVSTTLASFLLYSLSPFLPNPEILDNPELLADISTQYRRFMLRRKRLSRLPRNSNGLRRILKSLSPTCEEIIAGKIYIYIYICIYIYI